MKDLLRNCGSTRVLTFPQRPVSDYWTISILPQASCINQTAHLLYAGTANVLLDIVIVLLPLPVIKKLRLPRNQQIALISLLCTGFLATVAGAARTYYLYQANTTSDPIWACVQVWLTSGLELYLSIVRHSMSIRKNITKSIVDLCIVASNQSLLCHIYA